MGLPIGMEGNSGRESHTSSGAFNELADTLDTSQEWKSLAIYFWV